MVVHLSQILKGCSGQSGKWPLSLGGRSHHEALQFSMSETTSWMRARQRSRLRSGGDLASGPATPMDFGDVKKRIREELEARKSGRP